MQISYSRGPIKSDARGQLGSRRKLVIGEIGGYCAPIARQKKIIMQIIFIYTYTYLIDDTKL